jgi:hypothetical protein
MEAHQPGGQVVIGVPAFGTLQCPWNQITSNSPPHFLRLAQLSGERSGCVLSNALVGRWGLFRTIRAKLTFDTNVNGG